jgi:mannose/fructose/N-acetylgalactosamine-specific phosphotransferase system component IIC
MEPEPRPTFSLAGAGGTLIGMTLAVMVLCTLVGWVFGSWEWGLLVGAILGIPVGIAMTIRQYGNL